MIKNLLEKKEENEQGFTLIELMVVVLIIAILLAIAIPTFLGAKNTANARAAEANLRNALTAETSYFTNNNQVYGTATPMTAVEGAITWTDTAGATSEAPPAVSNTVFIIDNAGPALANTSTVPMLAIGKDNNCYYIQDTSGTVTYGKGGENSSGACTTTLPTMYPNATGSSANNGASW